MIQHPWRKTHEKQLVMILRSTETTPPHFHLKVLSLTFYSLDSVIEIIIALREHCQPTIIHVVACVELTIALFNRPNLVGARCWFPPRDTY